VSFQGFSDDAFQLLLEGAADPGPAWQKAHREPMERFVREQMMALCDELTAEFGRPYVYRLHRPEIFWKRQVGILSASDSVGYRLELTFTGLTIAAGWSKERPWQRRAYQDAVADEVRGPALTAIVADLEDRGWEVVGRLRKRPPPPLRADHPRAHLLRNRTLSATRGVGRPAWLQMPAGSAEVRALLREACPLVRWLAEVIPSAPP